jgi:hypothetical protein
VPPLIRILVINAPVLVAARAISMGARALFCM